jgi:hypothetical protein
MQCDQFEDRVQLVLDQRQDPEHDPQLRAHADVCPDCRQILGIQAQLLDALDMTEVPELPVEFSRQVVARVQPSVDAAPTAVSRRIAPILLAVAASLVIGLFSAAVIWMSSDRSRLAQDDQDVPPARVATPPTPQVNEGDNWWKISPGSLATLYPTDVRQRHREQVETIAGELKPVTTPFATAASALRRAIPVGKNRNEGQPQAAVPQVWPRDFS